MIKAGKLRHRMTLQHRVELEDGSGGRSTEWLDDGLFYASIRQATSLETFNAGRQNNVVTHMITMRHTEKVNEKSRFLFRGRTFNVVSIDDVMELGRKLSIQVKEAR